MPRTRKSSFLRSARFNRKLAVFGSCLLISALFWFLLAFNNYSTTWVTVPLQYINMPDDPFIMEKLPQEGRLEIGGNGYQLLSYLLNPRKGLLTIDGRYIGMSKSAKPGDAFLTTLPALDLFNIEHNEVNALRVVPDTIFFSYLNKGFRKVPVILDADIRFDKQYGLADSIRVNPDSIHITGPSPVLDRLKQVVTEPFKLQNINRSGTYKVKIKEPDSRLSYAPMEVSVLLDVDKYTEVRLEVPVEVEHITRRDSLLIVPEKVTVTCSVALRSYSRVTPREFKIVADAKELTTRRSGKLRLYVREFPVFVKNIRVDPEYVDCIIRKQ